jgi:hypothetical protein
MSNDVNTIEIEIEKAREWVAKHEALERLQNNADFQLLISDGYFKEEAARIVGLKADPQFIFAGKEQMQFLNVLEKGVGALQQYFRQIEMQANAARQGMGEMEETRDAVNAESLNAVIQ